MDEETRKVMEKMQAQIDELDRAIRGHDSQPGLITQVRTLVELYRSDIEHLKELIETKSKYEAELEKEKTEKTVKYPDLLNRIGIPLLVAVLASVVATFLAHQFVP